MIPTTTFAAVLVGIGTLAAQSVGVTVSALTPLTAKVTDGLVVDSQTLPAGPLGPNGSVGAVLPSAATIGLASSQWQAYANNQYAFVYLTHALQNSAALPTFTGRCGRHEFLVEFTSAIPRTTRLTVARQLELTPGAPAPTLAIDFDNDGTIDIANPTPLAGTVHTMSFGPQPLQVRVVVDASLGAQLGVYDRLILYLEPENSLAVAQPVASCDASLPQPPPLLHTSFDDRGIDLFLYSLPGQPSVLVFGFTPQPVLLSFHGPLPCILLPSPDVALLATGPFHLPLPASVRPVTFYVQGVTLAASGILSTTGYAVQAN